MKILALLFIATMTVGAYAAEPAPPTNDNLGLEVQLGYPAVQLGNPDGTKANYDGIAVRGGLNIPLIRRKSFDIFVTPGAKYFDLENVSNSSNQYESANIVAVGAGISVRISRVWFGSRYNHLWGRHYASGEFSDRASYQMNNLEYYGGLYYKFDRLGLGLQYTTSSGTIGKADTGLNSDTPYKESIYSVQFTFDMGESLWKILGGLF